MKKKNIIIVIATVLAILAVIASFNAMSLFTVKNTMLMLPSTNIYHYQTGILDIEVYNDYNFTLYNCTLKFSTWLTYTDTNPDNITRVYSIGTMQQHTESDIEVANNTTPKYINAFWEAYGYTQP
jgi:hypothetical protein